MPAWSVEAQQRLRLGPASAREQALQERTRLLADGESRLAAGDAAGAALQFEAATQILHAADAELSLVRAQVQAGEYRRALAFAAHAAGAHLDEPAGNALYAWLLHVGGQGRYAARLLDEAARRQPDAAPLREARAALTGDWPQARGPLAAGIGRSAPYAWGATVPPNARVVGSAVLGADGRRAWAPAALIAGAARVWLRNGLGQTVAATADPVARDGGVELALASVLAAPPEIELAAREPFAGSVGYTLEYAPGSADAAWPILRMGFFAGPSRDGAPRPLGLGLPPGPRGGPVFDRHGRLAGLATGGSPDRLRPAGQGFAMAATDTVAAVAVDALYERGLRLALQLIVEPARSVALATAGAEPKD